LERKWLHISITEPPLMALRKRREKSKHRRKQRVVEADRRRERV
jgi:hypothetical protein